MTSDACRLVRPGAAAQWSPAHNGYVSVLPSGSLARGSSSSGGALVRLEPCEGKLSRTVLSGARARNRPRLPDSICGRPQKQFLISIRFVRVSGAALHEGVEAHLIEGVLVHVATCTKTVAKCLKYRKKIGLDVALQALRE